MASFLEQVGEAAFRRGFEEVAEPHIERMIRDQVGENETVKAILRDVNRIPGLRIGGNALAKTVGELINKYADNLWPNDRRPQTAVLRQVLKGIGPALMATADAGADALQRVGNAEIDKMISSPATAQADRKAAFDQGVFLWLDEFPGRYLIPAKNADGSIKLDPQTNLPIILDPEVMARMNLPKYTQSTTRTVGGGKGQQSRTVTDPPQRPNIKGPYHIADAIQIAGLKGFSQEDAEAIKRLLTPKASYFASWGDDVWEVIRAYNATFTRRKAETGFDWLDQEESEGLVQTMLKSQPDVTLLKELVGKRFKARIGQNGAHPGEMSIADCDELEQVVFDMWLGGEQPKVTKLIRRARRVRRSGAIQGLSPFGVMASVAGITSFIWMPIVGMVLVLLVSVLLFVQGVFTPITGGTVPFLGSAYDSKSFALWSVFGAGWLAFVVTWFFPIFQTATAWVRTLFPSLKEDWLTSLGRRIVAFGLLFCSGIEFYAVALNVAPIWRVVILASAGVGIAVSMGLVEAGYRYMAEEMVKNAAKPAILAFGIIPLLLVFTVGVAQGNPTHTSATWAWLSAITMWQWLGLGALAVFALFIVSLFFGKSKEGTGGGDRAMTFASIMLGGGAFLAVLFLGGWMVLAGLHEIGSWFGGSASATSPVPTQVDNGPWFDRTGMCNDPATTFEQRQILKCP